ncbi:beta-propeller fold lactonase family protein [Hazenella sp. IB182357]|uniref:Beta-propeller fold lactonase family protein n=1 Tax=Polycladospora coralii TaxID=2771432 RepID=A0A926RU89_9BACL|nr:beta-propeller fold lactonase family protein [Polycladospora coralii]MBD1372643.1 beta-propeller fold lactonase family protein [Polycladospora coralii]MBS7531249.1 beta-propeller fold lactonase family protein [Polycladospora coralii]
MDKMRAILPFLATIQIQISSVELENRKLTVQLIHAMRFVRSNMKSIGLDKKSEMQMLKLINNIILTLRLFQKKKSLNFVAHIKQDIIDLNMMLRKYLIGQTSNQRRFDFNSVTRFLAIIHNQISERSLANRKKLLRLKKLFQYILGQLRTSEINKNLKMKLISNTLPIIHSFELWTVSSKRTFASEIKNAIKQLITSMRERIEVANSVHFYVLNQGSQSTSVINSFTGNQTNTFRVQATPVYAAISSDKKFVYVANQGTTNPGKLTQYQVSTNQTFQFNVDNKPAWVVVSANGNLVYTANSGTNTISVINVTNRVVRGVTVGSSPRSLAFSTNQSKLYVCNYNDHSVSVVNVSTLSILGTIPVGKNPNQVVASPDGERIYVANQGENSISVIDVEDDNPVSVPKIGLTGRPAFIRFNFSANSPIAYISTTSNSALQVIDVSTSEVIRTITANNPITSAITSDNATLYLCQQGGNQLSVINTESLKIIKNIALPGNPITVALTPDESQAYVVLNDKNLVAVINTSLNLLATTLQVMSNPRFIVTEPFA